ncbi:unnamed protein product [Amoebophrya sp. A25]|nr:unnamed protein product [Amoebophrya sp. A25]|eukprot:GSA25T00027037001.1
MQAKVVNPDPEIDRLATPILPAIDGYPEIRVANLTLMSDDNMETLGVVQLGPNNTLYFMKRSQSAKDNVASSSVFLGRAVNTLCRLQLELQQFTCSASTPSASQRETWDP